MATCIGWNDLASGLSIKLTEVLYVPRVWQWLSIFCCQEDTSRAANLGQSKGALLARGELVSAFSCKHLPEHQIIHLDLSATHEPLSIVLECFVILCILNSRLPCSLIDQVNILALKLVLHSFIVYGDLWGEDGLRPVHHEERHLTRGSSG
jgi:hypothetical protein